MGSQKKNTMQFILLFVVICAGTLLGEEGSDCCMSKTVGPHTYTLIENDASAITMGCKSPCVYQRDEEPGTRFCFKTGDHPVTCTQKLVKIHNALPHFVQVSVTLTIGPNPRPIIING